MLYSSIDDDSFLSGLLSLVRQARQTSSSGVVCLSMSLIFFLFSSIPNNEKACCVFVTIVMVLSVFAFSVMLCLRRTNSIFIF